MHDRPSIWAQLDGYDLEVGTPARRDVHNGRVRDSKRLRFEQLLQYSDACILCIALGLALGAESGRLTQAVGAWCITWPAAVRGREIRETGSP